MLTVRELLRRALAELKQDGWVKGDFHSPNGQHCALGAVEDVLREEFGKGGAGGYFDSYNPEAASLYQQARGVLDAVAADRGFGEDGIVGLNDAEKTTFDMVRDAFQEAIARAKVTA